MSETAVRLSPGFSTADAEYPEIKLKDGTLKINFVDYKGQEVAVHFHSAAAVSWQETDVA